MLQQQRLTLLPRYELTRNDGEERTYDTPDGTFFSVTAALQGSRDPTALAEWRESIGAARADAIRDLAAFRGTHLHTSVENFLTDGTEPGFSFLHTPYWNSIRPFVRCVESVVILEAPVWHPDGYAGTLDCLAYVGDIAPHFIADGAQPSLLDWKTADKPCNKQKLYEYSLQLAAYRHAANYVYRSFGLNINRALLVVALPDQHYQLHILDEDQLNQLYRHFLARLQHFTRARS